MFKKKRNRRLFALSFAVVFFGLFGTVSILYYISSVPVVEHLPSTIPSYSPPWARFVPDGVLQLTFRNFSALNSLNNSILADNSLLSFREPKYDLPSKSVESLITVVFSKPNATVDIAIMNKQNFTELLGAFNSLNSSRNVGNAILYRTEVVNNKTFVSGWSFVVPYLDMFGFSQGSSDALQAVNLILGTINGTISSIAKDNTLMKMFYIVGGIGNHLGFTYDNFPGLVRTGNSTLQVLDYDGVNVKTFYVVSFKDTDYAVSQFSYFKSQYFASQQFKIYDNFLLAIKTQPFSKLASAFASLG